eukprot:SAG22_NODE_54_length_23787_cov_12.917511_19_plen_79_part_00
MYLPFSLAFVGLSLRFHCTHAVGTSTLLQSDFSFDEDGIAFDSHPHNNQHAEQPEPGGGMRKVPRAELNAAMRALVPL